MVNTLRHYHLGCGERLQTFYTLIVHSVKMKQQPVIGLKKQSVNGKNREQH